MCGVNQQPGGGALWEALSLQVRERKPGADPKGDTFVFLVLFSKMTVWFGCASATFFVVESSIEATDELSIEPSWVLLQLVISTSSTSHINTKLSS